MSGNTATQTDFISKESAQSCYGCKSDSWRGGCSAASAHCVRHHGWYATPNQAQKHHGSSEILKCVADFRKFSRHMCPLWKLKRSLLQRKSGRNSRQVCCQKTTEDVCDTTKPCRWRRETLRQNKEVDDAITAKHQSLKAQKAGKCTRASYNTAKCISRRVVHHARHEGDNVVYEGIDCNLSDIFRLANQMRKENGVGDKPVKNDSG